ncbi:MAG: LPXTG cell wall anchor domain-containing protein [Intestinibaculum porci]|uniref:LPXTG cell wall anchor domain-containing protein n=1 Tax=Intestinibaculum porci TaxID=2487118 RepID=UPI00240924DF|nr:LPXTG cell wall anchor domain-containing protein [Intestinibaculum porci]MDD6423662.1 LPXTG cell wall anchor domain-containing protein [Intestinibaculum porci]
MCKKYTFSNTNQKRMPKNPTEKQPLRPIIRFIWQQAAPFEMNAVESRIFEIRNENIDVPMLTTGGSGTTMYYVAAAAVAAACAAIYVIRKRKRS